jgi:hypothetical protein
MRRRNKEIKGRRGRGRRRRGVAKKIVKTNPTKVLFVSKVPLQDFFMPKKSKVCPIKLLSREAHASIFLEP